MFNLFCDCSVVPPPDVEVIDISDDEDETGSNEDSAEEGGMGLAVMARTSAPTSQPLPHSEPESEPEVLVPDNGRAFFDSPDPLAEEPEPPEPEPQPAMTRVTHRPDDDEPMYIDVDTLSDEPPDSPNMQPQNTAGASAEPSSTGADSPAVAGIVPALGNMALSSAPNTPSEDATGATCGAAAALLHALSDAWSARDGSGPVSRTTSMQSAPRAPTPEPRAPLALSPRSATGSTSAVAQERVGSGSRLPATPRSMRFAPTAEADVIQGALFAGSDGFFKDVHRHRRASQAASASGSTSGSPQRPRTVSTLPVGTASPGSLTMLTSRPTARTTAPGKVATPRPLSRGSSSTSMPTSVVRASGGDAHMEDVSPVHAANSILLPVPPPTDTAASSKRECGPTPPRYSREDTLAQALKAAKFNRAEEAGAVIDLTLSDSDEDDRGVGVVLGTLRIPPAEPAAAQEHVPEFKRSSVQPVPGGSPVVSVCT